MQPCPVRPSGSGPLSEVVRWVERTLREMQIVSTPGMQVARGPNGTALRPTGIGDGSQAGTIERLTLVTQSAQYLFCERVTDSGQTFYVAKPEGFYTTDSVGGGSTYVAYPDYSTTTSVAVGNLDAAAGYRQITFPVSPTPIIMHQRITPAYLAGYSVIYAMRLAEPLVLGAATCTHIDLNIGDVRRWETLGQLDASNNAPVTFT